LTFAQRSVEGERYGAATPRERALLGVVHARSLAANGMNKAAAKALLRAEDDLAKAHEGIEEPNRTLFFCEHPLPTRPHVRCGTWATGKALCGSSGTLYAHVVKHSGACTQSHSVHGAMQIADGSVEEARSTWSGVLDAMDEGIYSGRARQTVADIRGSCLPTEAADSRGGVLDARAAAYLAQVDDPQCQSRGHGMTLRIEPVGVVVEGRALMDAQVPGGMRDRAT